MSLLDMNGIRRELFACCAFDEEWNEVADPATVEPAVRVADRCIHDVVAGVRKLSDQSVPNVVECATLIGRSDGVCPCHALQNERLECVLQLNDRGFLTGIQ